jgi:ribose 1,5-bisphosphokinase PhnN
MLKGAQVYGYQEDWGLSMEQMVERYPLFAVRLPLQAKPCDGCEVIGQRLEIRGRHNSDELHAMLKGEVYQHMFEREWLLEAPQEDRIKQTNTQQEGCR